MHVKGSETAVADAFSRLCSITMPTVIKLSQIEEEQASDPELVHLLKGPTSLKLQRVRFDVNISLYCDVSTGSVRPYVPKSLRNAVFSFVHGLSHLSGRSTVHQVRQKFVWPSMNKNVLEWCRVCLPCQRSKIHKHNHLHKKSKCQTVDLTSSFQTS